MKKMIAFALLLTMGIIANAQNYLRINITEIQDWQELTYCASDYDSIVIEKESNCTFPEWMVRLNGENSQYYTTNEITLTSGQDDMSYSVRYFGNGTISSREFWVKFSTFQDSELWAQDRLWIRPGEEVWLQAWGGYNYQQSNGSTDDHIVVTEDGTYWVRIYNNCGELWDTIQVCKSVEIYRAGVDPATNKNRVLWQTTPEQATYVSSVKVERDGMVVGTVPYTDGEFLDNIGSENAARVYRITAIANDGTECPLPSYQFGTFNTIISPDIANPNLMNFSWEDPFIEEGSPYSVVAYRIGRFNENTGEFNVIDQLSANVHLGKYDMDLFNGDYGIVAAVFNNTKDNEELAFSNRSDNEIVGIGEQNGENFGIYPNPAKDCFTVEGTGVITVTNTLGQTILTQEIDGKATIELPQGIYFVKLGDAVRKIVVE